MGLDYDIQAITLESEIKLKSPLLVQWPDIVRGYRITDLAVRSDRLVVLRGIMNALIETSHAAGRWKACLSKMLLWLRTPAKPHGFNNHTHQTLLHHFPS